MGSLSHDTALCRKVEHALVPTHTLHSLELQFSFAISTVHSRLPTVPKVPKSQHVLPRLSIEDPNSC